ncbi:MAG TPA: DPP IV N-terminal domain-containing protein [Bryobacteraceae bacterium]|nr:DPP IV N-terminal domain-containing protein [Bryobacteraceae bacterium]
MKANTPALVAIAALSTAALLFGQATPEDYARSEGLREAWMYLTKNVADPARWLGDSKQFVYRKTVPGGFDFVIMDAETLQKKPAFDQARLAAALTKATGATYTAQRLPFTDAQFSGDQSAISFTFAESRWRCRLTDYMCAPASFRTGQPRGFGVVRDLSVPADNTPRRSPDGHWEAFVNNFNVAIRPAKGGAMAILSQDGSPSDFYDPESIVWSPDSKKLAAYRVLPGYHRNVTHVESSPKDQLQPKVSLQFYPKPGDAVDIDRPVLFHVDPAKQVAIDTALFPNPYEMTRLGFRKDSGTLAFEYDQRGHQTYRLIEVDAETGKARVAAGDEAKTFINTGSNRLFRHDVNGLGNEVIWMSERDGWNHLYLYDGRAGTVHNQITKGEWVVRQVVKVDDEKRQIWFAANGMRPNEDPYLQHYYRINFDGTGLTPITTANAYHDVAFSADMTYYVDTYSRTDMPNIMELHRTADGSLVKGVEQGDMSDLVAAGFKPPEVFVAKGRDGKTDIWGLIVKPRNFDPSKKYPVVENIYAGPHGSFTPKTFWPFGLQSGGDKVIGMQSLADMGFVVVQMDGMGTINRSKAFHDVAWKNIADAGFPDRILWHKAAAAKYPWYDATRVGIYGGSAGGQDTLLALLFHPEFYKVGVAYAGCYDNRMDKISWNEEWMGWPLDDSYSASSGVDNAWKLQGHLLMVVGELDENVDPSSTMQVVHALIEAHKDFDLIVAPGEGHTALRSSGPVDYGLRRMYDFFLRHLAGQQTPNWNVLVAAKPPVR